MSIDNKLDDILDSRSKVRIIRLFISRRADFMATGREIAHLISITPPAVHTALKDLYDQGIVKRDIVGRQHIYRINAASRAVADILQPAFQKERSIKEDIGRFLRDQLMKHKLNEHVSSIILYGSIARGETHATSDCDIAVIAKNLASKTILDTAFTEKISGEFSAYFGIHLDTYLKTGPEFSLLLKRNKPPVSTLVKAYEMIYGKNPM